MNHRKKLINYYQILGVNENSSIDVIQKKYAKLTLNYHPNINKNADPQFFELIQNAWDCLSDKELKKKHDEQLKRIHNDELKKNYDEEINIQKEDELKKDFERFKARKYKNIN